MAAIRIDLLCHETYDETFMQVPGFTITIQGEAPKKKRKVRFAPPSLVMCPPPEPLFELDDDNKLFWEKTEMELRLNGFFH